MLPCWLQRACTKHKVCSAKQNPHCKHLGNLIKGKGIKLRAFTSAGIIHAYGPLVLYVTSWKARNNIRKKHNKESVIAYGKWDTGRALAKVVVKSN